MTATLTKQTAIRTDRIETPGGDAILHRPVSLMSELLQEVAMDSVRVNLGGGRRMRWALESIDFDAETVRLRPVRSDQQHRRLTTTFDSLAARWSPFVKRGGRFVTAKWPAGA